MGKVESESNPHVPTHVQRSHSVNKESRDAERRQMEKNLRMDMAMTFGTPEGLRVLKWLCDQSGHLKNYVGGNPALGIDVLQGTFYNAARMSLYLELRSLIPPEMLKKIEYENPEEIFT